MTRFSTLVLAKNGESDDNATCETGIVQIRRASRPAESFPVCRKCGGVMVASKPGQTEHIVELHYETMQDVKAIVAGLLARGFKQRQKIVTAECE